MGELKFAAQVPQMNVETQLSDIGKIIYGIGGGMKAWKGSCAQPD